MVKRKSGHSVTKSARVETLTGLDTFVASHRQRASQVGYTSSEIADKIGVHSATALRYVKQLIHEGKCVAGQGMRIACSGRRVTVPVYCFKEGAIRQYVRDINQCPFCGGQLTGDISEGDEGETSKELSIRLGKSLSGTQKILHEGVASGRYLCGFRTERNACGRFYRTPVYRLKEGAK